MLVKKLSVDHGQFPTPAERIAEWKLVDGSVYSGSLADIAEHGDFDAA